MIERSEEARARESRVVRTECSLSLSSHFPFLSSAAAAVRPTPHTLHTHSTHHAGRPPAIRPPGPAPGARHLLRPPLRRGRGQADQGRRLPGHVGRRHQGRRRGGQNGPVETAHGPEDAPGAREGGDGGAEGGPAEGVANWSRRRRRVDLRRGRSHASPHFWRAECLHLLWLPRRRGSLVLGAPVAGALWAGGHGWGRAGKGHRASRAWGESRRRWLEGDGALSLSRPTHSELTTSLPAPTPTHRSTRALTLAGTGRR